MPVREETALRSFAAGGGVGDEGFNLGLAVLADFDDGVGFGGELVAIGRLHASQRVGVGFQTGRVDAKHFRGGWKTVACTSTPAARRG